MEEVVKRSFWWPSLAKDVQRYVEGCEICQRVKLNRQRKAAPLVPHAVPEQNWQVITEDLIGPLPESQGHNAIYVVVDKKSKMIKIQVTDVELTGMGTAWILRDRVVRSHGLFEKVISD